MRDSRARRPFLLLLPTALFSALAMAAGPPVIDDCTGACAQDLAVIRLSTAVYHEEGAALADGFVPDPVCVQLPGVGAMGIHYSNPSRTRDIDVDVRYPEVLLYEPEPDGSRRLVGVEFLAPVLSNGAPWFGGPNDPPPVVDNPPPVLFGRTFQGPMPGHNPQMPWHYDFHVWAWRHNPSGTFAQWNPKVVCQ